MSSQELKSAVVERALESWHAAERVRRARARTAAERHLPIAERIARVRARQAADALVHPEYHAAFDALLAATPEQADACVARFEAAQTVRDRRECRPQRTRPYAVMVPATPRARERRDTGASSSSSSGDDDSSEPPLVGLAGVPTLEGGGT